jgi:hypothetical protein
MSNPMAFGSSRRYRYGEREGWHGGARVTAAAGTEETPRSGHDPFDLPGRDKMAAFHNSF